MIVLNDVTRGKIYGMLEIELEKEILSRTSWFSDLYISKDVALGYMIGLLEMKAENIIRQRGGFVQESLKEAGKMIREKIPSISEKIKIEQSK